MCVCVCVCVFALIGTIKLCRHTVELIFATRNTERSRWVTMRGSFSNGLYSGHGVKKMTQHNMVVIAAYCLVTSMSCCSTVFVIWSEGSVLFNDALNTFYLRLYGVGHMVKDHSDNERGNLLAPHGLIFSMSSKGSFICTIPQTG